MDILINENKFENVMKCIKYDKDEKDQRRAIISHQSSAK